MHLHRQRESEFQGKEFVASPQLGQWSDEHDFKRLLTDNDNDNVFYTVRPQPASIKSTSFIGSSGGGTSVDYDKSKFINELPAPKFHSSHGKHMSQQQHSSLSGLNKHYPKFNDFIRTSGGSETTGPPIEIPHYVLRDGPEKPFSHNHRTAHIEHNTNPFQNWPEDPRSDVRVQPLNGIANEAKHSSHRSTNFIHSPQPDHPYTFDFGHDESLPPSSKPALEFYDLNEYEKFPHIEPEKHLHARHHQHHLQQHHHHAPRHG